MQMVIVLLQSLTGTVYLSKK